MVVLIQVSVRVQKTFFKKILSENKDLKIITIGSKGFDQLKRSMANLLFKK